MSVPDRQIPQTLSSLLSTAVLDGRKARRWSQERLASKCGLARKTIIRVEAGVRVNSQSIWQICDILEIDPFELNEQEASSRRLHVGTDSMRRIRFERGLTLKQCASAAGVSVATFSRWERSLTTPRQLVTVRHNGSWYANNLGLADLLGVSGLRELTKMLGGFDEFAPAEALLPCRQTAPAQPLRS